MGKAAKKKQADQPAPEMKKSKKKSLSSVVKTSKKEERKAAAGATDAVPRAHAGDAISAPDKHAPVQKRLVSLKEYKESLKTVVLESVDNYKKDIDPEKASAFRREALKILKGGAIALVIAVAVSAVLLLPEIYFSGKVLAGTSVGGVSVGSLPINEAKNKLMVETERYLKTPITFILADGKISFTPEELGVQILTDQTLNSIPVLKFRDANPVVLAGSFITKREIPIQYSLDRENAVTRIEDKLGLLEGRAKNAKLVYRDDAFVVEPEKQGEAINRELFAAALQADIGRLEGNQINLQLTVEQPRITAAGLEGQKDRLAGLIENTLTLRSGEQSFKFKPSEHLDGIEFKEKTALEFKGLGVTLPLSLGGQKNMEIAADSPVKLVSKLEIAFNGGVVSPYLQENFIKNIEVPTSGVTITRQENGNIKIEGKGEDGRSVPGNRMIAGMNLAVNRAIEAVPVPVVTEKAPVNIAGDLMDLGIKELLATGHTSFYGSHANRVHNINVGIKKYNGVLVKPGEEFSFNKILGEVDAKNGYLPEKVIKKNKVETEYGGGICQVSSTLYRAALFAGVPITERNPHSWLVTYYGQVLGPGLDATIYLGVSDVKFINDTPAYLLVQSYTDGANAYFKFYGTSDGRTVAMDGPYGGGLHYKWYRILNKNGQETKETIVSNYKPMPAPDPPPEKPKEVAQKPDASKPTL